MYLRQGEVTTRTPTWFRASDRYSTYEVAEVFQNEGPLKDFLFEVHIELDDLKLKVKRAEYSFFVWLAMLGGITKIVR